MRPASQVGGYVWESILDFARPVAVVADRLARAPDDLDVVGAFQALKPGHPVSHLEFIRNPRLAARSLDHVIAGDSFVDLAGFVPLTFPAPQGGTRLSSNIRSTLEATRPRWRRSEE